MFLRRFAAAAMLLMLGIGSVSAQEGSTLASGVGDNRNQALELSAVIERPQYATNWYNAITFTGSATDPGACVGYDHSVWATFVAPQTGKLDINTYGSLYDTMIAVYKTSAVTANQVACNNDYLSQTTSSVTVSIQMGVRYYVLIGSVNPSPVVLNSVNDELVLNFSSNMYRDMAFVVPATGRYTNVQDAIQTSTDDMVAPSCSAATNYSAWYSFKPTSSGRYEFSTAGSSYDTVLAVFRTSDGFEVACNDDINTNGDSWKQSRVRPLLTANTRYYIYIGRYSNDPTTLPLTLNLRVRPF